MYKVFLKVLKLMTQTIKVTPEVYAGIEAAQKNKADAILISSVSGHARALCVGFRDKCNKAGLNHIILYIGGHLVIGESKWEDTEKLFKEMGFDRVYPPTTLPETAVADLKTDLGKRS